MVKPAICGNRPSPRSTRENGILKNLLELFHRHIRDDYKEVRERGHAKDIQFVQRAYRDHGVVANAAAVFAAPRAPPGTL